MVVIVNTERHHKFKACGRASTLLSRLAFNIMGDSTMTLLDGIFNRGSVYPCFTSGTTENQMASLSVSVFLLSHDLYDRICTGYDVKPQYHTHIRRFNWLMYCLPHRRQISNSTKQNNKHDSTNTPVKLTDTKTRNATRGSSDQVLRETQTKSTKNKN